MSETKSALRRGDVVWLTGSRFPLRRIFVRSVAGGRVEVRTSTFARENSTVRGEDVFADRDSCRKEILRRAEVEGLA
jgi:hypothetical protein